MTQSTQPPSAPQSKPNGKPSSGGEPAKVDVSLRLVSVNREAWNKTCIDIKVIEDKTDAKNPICNTELDKGSTTEVSFLKDSCNTLRLDFSIYRRKSCPPKVLNCPIEHESNPFLKRSTSDASSDTFIIVKKASNLLPLQAGIKISEPPEQLQEEATKFLAEKTGRFWYRLFFEDQPDAQFEAWKRNDSIPGIDFNDFVVDFKGENVKLMFENRPEMSNCK